MAESLTQEDNSTSVPKTNWLERLKMSNLGLVVALSIGLLTGLAASFESFDRILVGLGFKPNALELARREDRAKFSQNLIRAAWHRMFLMRRILSLQTATSAAALQQLENVRKDYDASFQQWNSD